MKLIERIALVIYSYIIIILAVVLSLLIFNWLDIESLSNMVEQLVTGNISSKVILVLNIIFILLSIKCIFFDAGSKEKNESKNSILLENSDGKLLITRETLENLVDGVVKGFAGAENVASKVEVDEESNVRVFINMEVKENVVIKDLSSNIQTKIKEAIKKTSDLSVKEVNIKVKNIMSETNTVQE